MSLRATRKSDMKIEIDNCYNMDCLDGMRLMQEQGLKADMLLTDIPYGAVNARSNGRERYQGQLRQIKKGKADELSFDLLEYLELTDAVIKNNFVIFCGTEQISQIRDFYDCKGYTTRLLIWEKTNPSPMNGEKVYLSGIECAVYAKKSGATFNGFCKNTVFKCPCGVNEIHPTQKPLKLWYELLQDNTNENQLVLDTCGGSFTTAVACHKLQRHYILFEKEKNYYDLGCERLKRETAQISIFDIMQGV